MSITRPSVAGELSGVHRGCIIEILGDPHPTKPWLNAILGSFVLGAIHHEDGYTTICPVGDDDGVQLHTDSPIRLLDGPQLISADDQAYLNDWCARTLAAATGHPRVYLPVPADDAARMWAIRSRVEGQIGGLFPLGVLLRHMAGHNCGVCGEPDSDACAEGC